MAEGQDNGAGGRPMPNWMKIGLLISIVAVAAWLVNAAMRLLL